MSGISSDEGDKLNTELNLVPFIDLLSSLVLFLLVTAVWLQVGTIPASVESKGKSRISPSETNRITLRLTSRGVQITWPGALAGSMPGQLPMNPTRLLTLMEAANKKNSSAVVAVSSEDSVEYGLVVQAIDVAKKAGFTTVALSTD